MHSAIAGLGHTLSIPENYSRRGDFPRRELTRHCHRLSRRDRFDNDVAGASFLSERGIGAATLNLSKTLRSTFSGTGSKGHQHDSGQSRSTECGRSKSVITLTLVGEDTRNLSVPDLRFLAIDVGEPGSLGVGRSGTEVS